MMATVTIQKRTRKKGVRYLVSYKVPMNGKKKHYKTFSKYREAQQAANDLRSMLDSGNLPDPKRTKLNALSFKQVERSFHPRLSRNTVFGWALLPGHSETSCSAEYQRQP
jgi:hypothetical protein